MTLRLIGQRFGRLLVLRREGSVGGKSAWAVRCDCGTEKVIRGDHMVRGQCVSCGCFRDDELRRRATTHGLTNTRVYRIWRDMRNRCHYEKYPERHLYGGRGIQVCARWRDSFEAFLADMGMPPPGMSIDRIETDGNYEPGNCRWATATEQARNRRPARRSPKGCAA